MKRFLCPHVEYHYEIMMVTEFGILSQATTFKESTPVKIRTPEVPFTRDLKLPGGSTEM
jgi:hypothetical protein